MPETRCEIRGRFVTSMRYPPTGRWPLVDRDAFIREIEEPFRVGQGVAVRVPGLRWAAIFGRWTDDGGDEVERLTEALRASDLGSEADEIRSW